MADSRIEELRRRVGEDPGSRLFAQLAEALEEFRRWWTPEQAAALRAGLTAAPMDEPTVDLPASDDQPVTDSPPPR